MSKLGTLFVPLREKGLGRVRARGQVIVLFALFLVVLLGAGAFVLDVARVYSLQRFERSVADAAALAGAQDLQDSPNTPTVSPPDQQRARCDALALLVSELGGSSAPNCTPPVAGYTTDIVNYGIAGTPYTVSIKTPSPSWVHVDPYHAVQVTVQQTNVSLTLARLFGQNSWNVGETSVAGIDHASRFAVETLRPPGESGTNPACSSSGTPQWCQDLNSNGNYTTLTAQNGNIGTNTDAVTNSNGQIVLQDSSGGASNGFYIWHYASGIPWNQTGTPPIPAGRLLPNLLPDPNYTVPLMAVATHTYPSYTAGVDSSCSLPSGYTLPPPSSPSSWVCLKPGSYTDNNIHFNSSTNVYLEPGVYFFSGTLQVDGRMVGGNEAGLPGVTIVFTAGAQFKQNNALLISLNAGSGYCGSTSGDCPAAAVQDNGNPVPAPSSDLPLLTIAVQKVPACFSGTTPVDGCSSSGVLTLPGNGNVNVGGVTYAPSDNVKINGNNSSSNGLIGQIIAWTITYSGNAQVFQYYPGTVGNGFMHLDEACSGLNTPCTP